MSRTSLPEPDCLQGMLRRAQISDILMRADEPKLEKASMRSQ